MNMNKLMMLVAASLISIASFAQPVTKIGNMYYELDSENKKATVSHDIIDQVDGSFDYTKYSGNIVIPETTTHNGVTYKVTAIKEHAFYWNEDLTSVTIPNSIENIEAEAFYGSSGLTSIRIPASVKSIGPMAFGRTGLNSIEVDKANKFFDSRNDCNALINSTTNELLAGSDKTVIPNSVTKIAKAAFADCMIKSIVIPNSVKEIGKEAFLDCINLTSVTLPNGLKVIEKGTFMGCTNLKSISLPESLTTIGDVAFEYSGLESITIPANVKEIGIRAFDECNNLKTVSNMATVPQTIYDGTFSSFNQLNVPEGSLEVYKNSPIWNQFFNTTGIDNVRAPVSTTCDGAYSLSGQRLYKTFKGVNIINGKKYISK